MSRRPQRRGLELPGDNRRSWLRRLRQLRSKWSVLAAALLGLALVLAYRAERADAIRQTRFAIRRVKQAVSAFRLETGRCPASIAEVVGFRGRARALLLEEPRDAWGTRLYMRCENDGSEPVVISAGPSRNFFADGHVL